MGEQGIQGPQGIPGEIGPTGPAGTSVTIMGSYDSVNELVADHETGNIGDGYLVGDDLYVWSPNENEWVDVGTIRGPQGVAGPQGPQGIEGPRGPMGEQGVQGLQGEQGVPGPRGEIGPTGPSGYALLSAYGGKYNNLSATIDTQKVGTWVEVPLTDDMDNINVVNNTPNAIVLEQDGIYEINFGVNFTPSSTNIMTVMVRENSVIIPALTVVRQVSANEAVNISASTIMELKASDKLDIALSATLDNVIVTLGPGMTAYLSVKKLDEAE